MCRPKTCAGGARRSRRVGWGMQAPFSGRDPLWAEAEYDGVFAWADGSRLAARFRGLCPLQGVVTDPHGRRWRVAYTGRDWLAPHLQPVARDEVRPLVRARAHPRAPTRAHMGTRCTPVHR